MTQLRPLVCLITPGHVASTPRLVKEADALVEAGYRVHVIAGRNCPPVDPLDADVLATAKWKHTTIDLCRRPGVFMRGLLRRMARLLVRHKPITTVRVAVIAHHPSALRLAVVASKVPAALFIGHCLAGLFSAAQAGCRRGVAYGFDAEDFHDGETETAATDPAETNAIRILQRSLLPGCAHLTASSPLISAKYAEVYGVKPLTVLNAFPRTQAPSAPVDPGRVTEQTPARFYWFSQTIGPGRGLEAVASILGRMRTPAELHLRGFVSHDYMAHLRQHAIRVGMRRPIQFLTSGAPAEMARLAAGAHIGLSTEETRPLNRDLCLTNKIFVYLLAGLPQLLSNTTAQTALAPELGEAAIIGQFDQPAETAQMLDRFFANPAAVIASRCAAWHLARNRFNWENEQQVFLRSVRNTLSYR